MCRAARPDSPATLSKSCSDKLALKQCTSLLSGVAALLISPDNAYLDTLVVPAKQFVPGACDRAWGSTGRLTPLKGKGWTGGYSFRPFQVSGTNLEYEFSRDKVLEMAKNIKGSNLSAAWSPYFSETLVNGVLQGRKQEDPEGASLLSRRKMAELLYTVESLDAVIVAPYLGKDSYGELKQAKASQARRLVKADVTREALKGWTSNGVDEFQIPQILSNDRSPYSCRP